MAHSLTNSKAERFMKRVSEFSTRGSRRGFVDIDLEIPHDQLERDYVDKLLKSAHIKELEEALSILESNLNIPDGMSLQEYRRCIRQAAWKYPIRAAHFEKYSKLRRKINRLKGIQNGRKRITSTVELQQMEGI